MNELCFFRQELLPSRNKLPVENYQSIHGDIYVEPWLFQKTNVN